MLPPIEEDESLSPLLRQRLQQPHLAFHAGNNEWIPIVVGCTIALVSDRAKIDGVAPYVITKMNWKPGKEEIELVAVGEAGTVRRILKFGTRYKGHHTASLDNADKLVDAATGMSKDQERHNTHNKLVEDISKLGYKK